MWNSEEIFESCNAYSTTHIKVRLPNIGRPFFIVTLSCSIMGIKTFIAVLFTLAHFSMYLLFILNANPSVPNGPIKSDGRFVNIPTLSKDGLEFLGLSDIHKDRLDFLNSFRRLCLRQAFLTAISKSIKAQSSFLEKSFLFRKQTKNDEVFFSKTSPNISILIFHFQKCHVKNTCLVQGYLLPSTFLWEPSTGY